MPSAYLLEQIRYERDRDESRSGSGADNKGAGLNAYPGRGWREAGSLRAVVLHIPTEHVDPCILSHDRLTLQLLSGCARAQAINGTYWAQLALLLPTHGTQADCSHSRYSSPFNCSEYSRLGGYMMSHALINPTGGNPVGPCGLAVQAISKCRSGMDVPASLHAVHAVLAMHRVAVIRDVRARIVDSLSEQ